MQPQAYIFDLDGLILDTGGCNSSLTVEGQLIAIADVEVLPIAYAVQDSSCSTLCMTSSGGCSTGLPEGCATGLDQQHGWQ